MKTAKMSGCFWEVFWSIIFPDLADRVIFAFFSRESPNLGICMLYNSTLFVSQEFSIYRTLEAQI